jgi:NADH-quinone oxidoreductase subunit A
MSYCTRKMARWLALCTLPMMLASCAPESRSATGAPLWPLALYFTAVLVLAGGMLGLSYVLGERHRGRAKDEPYESGIPPTGSAHVRFDVKFYSIAMFFVIFDLEATFIFVWALSVRELGWLGYGEVVVFIGVLLTALIYLRRVGALDWGTSGRRSRRNKE